MRSSSPINSVRLILSGAEIVLGPGEHVLGRSTACTVMVDDPLTSRRHAAITVCAEHVTVRDLGSRNGVLVNGDEIDAVRALVEGDLITLGSQAITVLQISRNNTPQVVGFVTSGMGRQVVKSSAQGKIQVTRPPLPDDDLAVGTTQGNGRSPSARPLPVFRLIVDAAARALEAGRPERAEKILEVPLSDVLATLRAGLPVEQEILEIVVDQAILLCEITRQQRWVDFLHELHAKLHQRLPAATAARLASLTQRGP